LIVCVIVIGRVLFMINTKNKKKKNRTSVMFDYLLNLSILLSRGNERNFDIFSSGERSRYSPKFESTGLMACRIVV